MTPTKTASRRSAPGNGWRARDVLMAAVIVAGVYLALQILWVGRSVFLLGFLGVLFGIVLSSGVDRLERWRIPRGLGAAIIVLSLLGLLVGLGALAAPQISRQMRDLRERIPQAAQQVRGWAEERLGGVAEALQPSAAPQGGQEGKAGQQSGEQAPGAEKSDSQAGSQQGGTQESGGQKPAPNPGDGITQQLGAMGKTFFSIFSSTLSALAGILVLIFVSIFVASDPGLYHRGLMHLFPHSVRPRAGEVLSATATTLRRWLVMQLVAMVVIGVVTTVALLVLGIPGAIALGIIAGFLEFIPYVGPILSAVPAIAMALTDSPDKAIYVVIAYIAIQQLEGLVLQPMLMKEGLELPPVLTILGQALFSIVLGFLGLLLAVPLIATVMIPIKMLYVRDVVGDEVTVPGEDEDD